MNSWVYAGELSCCTIVSTLRVRSSRLWTRHAPTPLVRPNFRIRPSCLSYARVICFADCLVTVLFPGKEGGVGRLRSEEGLPPKVDKMAVESYNEVLGLDHAVSHWCAIHWGLVCVSYAMLRVVWLRPVCVFLDLVSAPSSVLNGVCVCAC